VRVLFFRILLSLLKITNFEFRNSRGRKRVREGTGSKEEGKEEKDSQKINPLALELFFFNFSTSCR